MKRRRRIITRASIFVLLGAIVNIAVAWTLAMRPSPNRDFLANDGVFVRRVTVDGDMFDTHVSVASGEFGLSQSWHVLGIDLTRWVGESEYRAALPRWSRCWREEPLLSSKSIRPRPTSYCEFASGWPRLSLRCWYLYQWNLFPQECVVDSSGLLLLPQQFERGDPYNPTRRELPFIPIWPGFAVNTIFYAAILWGAWLLFAAPLALRRRVRIKRGLCPACAYDLRGGAHSACPECGALAPSPAGSRRSAVAGGPG